MLKKGKVNSRPDAVEERGRHQRVTNPKAPVSGLVENRSSFLTSADEKSISKKLPISKNVRKDGAGCLENDAFCISLTMTCFESCFKTNPECFQQRNKFFSFLDRVIGEGDGMRDVY